MEYEVVWKGSWNPGSTTISGDNIVDALEKHRRATGDWRRVDYYYDVTCILPEPPPRHRVRCDWA